MPFFDICIGFSNGAMDVIHTDLFSGLLPMELRSAGSSVFYVSKGIVKFLGIIIGGGVQISMFSD